MPNTPELVILLDDDRNHIGTMDKSVVHTDDTPLHLAFSCYITDDHDRVLLTRRALGKRTWPGVWTNSCCGHPAPGEEIADAVRRRAHQELGMTIDAPRVVLPEFRYRARSAEGVVENEVCPVFVAAARTTPDPDPAEVADFAWAPWETLHTLAQDTPWLISPWAAAQIPQLARA
ncbi:isopentenyl-diphosphate Delta-isomerase [Spiractinospora alimapuensis]|uniref:isopentenyl-diphosphate Delta-isomerase n=1 Tax=Spiractinospora alimapuensis TaxID=2820884 RepID=UPI001EEC039B|nr:isopentenyl-diphosphate Delta-isomerase [Spiractinospora alimapuensis]QVQ52848.1 isopentenyl-diphosphate Delta-isomerase [Spiractinospora alimapuensis]